MEEPVANGMVAQVDVVAVGHVDAMAVSVRISDPAAQFIDTSASRPSTAATKRDPHRYTIVVPTDDDAVVNVGAADGTRTLDKGIVARTKTHVHLHAKDKPQTMVALGQGAKDGWPSHAGDNLKANSGLMAVTDGKTWIEAKGHVYAISTESDATLRAVKDGKRVVVQADAGDINLIAQKAMLASSPVIVLSAPARVSPNVGVNYGTEWTGDVPETHAGHWGARAGALAAAVNAAHEVVMGLKKVRKAWKGGKLAPSVDGFLGAAKWLAEAGEGIHAMAELVDSFSTAKPKGGSVKIGADKHVSVLSGNSTELAGSVALTAAAGVWATVAAGVSASLKGGAFSGMSAALTSVNGLRKVEIGAEHGNVSIEAGKGVSIAAEGDDLDMGSEHSVHITGHGGFVTIGGGQAVHLAAGGADGMGLCVSSGEIGLGRVQGADALEKAKHEEAIGIAIQKATPKIVTRCKESHIIIDGSKPEMELKSGHIRILSGSGTIELNGGKVLAG
jgi:uncharacterized protein (DUF2345 family)